MPDVFSKKKRSQIMSLIRSTNTKPEVALRKLVSSTVYPRGYRYRIHHKKVIGKPDMVFVASKIAVFVDGAFWHGYDFKNRKKRLPKKYWLKKIEKNMERDKRVNRKLRKEGWQVVRIWEHDLKKRPEKVLTVIMNYLEKSL